jgi:hypothetical protein
MLLAQGRCPGHILQTVCKAAFHRDGDWNQRLWRVLKSPEDSLDNLVQDAFAIFLFQ